MNYTLETTGRTFIDVTQSLWERVYFFLPDLLAGTLVLIIGLILASVLSSVARRVVRYSQLDKLSDDSETTKRLKAGGLEFSPSALVGFIVKWFFIVVTFIAVADILGLDQVNVFLNQVILYIPQVIAAILILVVGIVVGDMAEKIVKASAGVSRVAPGRSELLGSVAKWAIVVFAVFAALSQLGVAEDLIKIVVAGVTLALAIAVGLGSKDKVKSVLDKF